MKACGNELSPVYAKKNLYCPGRRRHKLRLTGAAKALAIYQTSAARWHAPLLRVAVRPSPTLRLAVPSWVMVEKITSVRRERACAILGRLSTSEMMALGQSLAVLLAFG